MLIKIDNFSGIIPKDSVKLIPEKNGYTANNLTAYSGRLEPLTTADVPGKIDPDEEDYPDALTELGAPTCSAGSSFTLDVDDLSCNAWVFRYENGVLAYTWEASLTRTSYDYTDEGMTISYLFPAYPVELVWTIDPSDNKIINQFRGGQYQLSLSGVGAIPSNSPSIDGQGMYGQNELSLTRAGSQYGKLKILKVDNGDINQTRVMTPQSSQMIYTETLQRREITFHLTYQYNDNLVNNCYYIQSYVDAEDREGPPSDPSNLGKRTAGKPLTVSGASGARLYRSGTGKNTDDFYLLKTMTGASYEDWTQDSELGSKLPDKWGNRVADMEDVSKMPGDFLVAWKENVIYFSEPGLDYVWPEEYQIEIDENDEVVKIQIILDYVYVFTQTTDSGDKGGHIYVISATHPESTTVSKLAYRMPLVSLTGSDKWDDHIYFASEDGLVYCHGGSARIITYPYFSKAGWEELEPENMTVIADGDRVFITFSGTEAGGTEEPLGATAKHLMFKMSTQGQIEFITTINTDSVLTWKSKIFQLPRPISWSCARVVASEYTPNKITFNLYAKDDIEDVEASLPQVFTKTVADDQAFRITSEYPSKMWQLEVTANSACIDAIEVATSMNEIKGK